jgi:hypothetical protein
MLIYSDKHIMTKCQPPALRTPLADHAAVARLGPDDLAAASRTSHHPPNPHAGSTAPSGPSVRKPPVSVFEVVFAGSLVFLYINRNLSIGFVQCHRSPRTNPASGALEVESRCGAVV